MARWKESRLTGVFSPSPLLRYHLKDVIVGKIFFLLVRIKIKNMELAIIKRETTGSG
jgi:vacuolar protein sorting-associated protein 26